MYNALTLFQSVINDPIGYIYIYIYIYINNIIIKSTYHSLLIKYIIYIIPNHQLNNISCDLKEVLLETIKLPYLVMYRAHLFGLYDSIYIYIYIYYILYIYKEDSSVIVFPGRNVGQVGQVCRG